MGKRKRHRHRPPVAMAQYQVFTSEIFERGDAYGAWWWRAVMDRLQLRLARCCPFGAGLFVVVACSCSAPGAGG